MQSMNSTKHSVINHFNERGVYTGTSVQDSDFETVGVYPSEELAIEFCERQGFEYEVLEDEI